MSEPEERLSRTEFRENTSGVVLGYWDHEKTPTLIQDLERSISLVELKCKKLLQELTLYKKYLEKPGEIDFHMTVFQRKSQKLKAALFLSGSEPEIAFRKNFINFQKIRQIFEEQFQEKLGNINKELAEAARKIGLKDSIILFPNNKYLKKVEGQAADEGKLEGDEEIEEDGGEVGEKFIELSTFKAKARSDSLITDNGGDPDFSKITKNQLELYQKLSRLSMRRNFDEKLKVKSFKGNKIKFFLKRKTLKYRQGFLTRSKEWKKPKPGRKTLRKSKNSTALFQARKSPLVRDSRPTICSRDSEKVKNFQSLIDAIGKDSHKSCGGRMGSENRVEDSLALGVPLRKVVPFSVCISASGCYEAGSNMRQIFSVTKHERKTDVRISASEKVHAGAREKHVGDLTSKPSTADVKKRRSIPWTSQTKSKSFESEEQRGNAWISQCRTSSNFRKVRSKNTERSMKNFLKYLKTNTGLLNNDQKSVIQSESKTTYAVGSKIMISGCQRTDIFEIGKSNNCFKNASGDGNDNDECEQLNMEWAKVYSYFLKIYRKYVCLKEKVSGGDLTFADEELKSLEKDIDYSIEKYKEFLEFYTKFLHLNHRLKSLKIACETKTCEPVTSCSSKCHRKLWSFKPTHSMAMKDAFREVQALQDKINLVND